MGANGDEAGGDGVGTPILIGLQYINKQLEKFIGINDDELAEELWRMALDRNASEFSLAVANSDLNEFKFTDDFLFDVWAIVNDVLHGRLTGDA